MVQNFLTADTTLAAAPLRRRVRIRKREQLHPQLENAIGLAALRNLRENFTAETAHHLHQFVVGRLVAGKGKRRKVAFRLLETVKRRLRHIQVLLDVRIHRRAVRFRTARNQALRLLVKTGFGILLDHREAFEQRDGRLHLACGYRRAHHQAERRIVAHIRVERHQFTDDGMVPVVKILKLVLRQILDLAFLGSHELFQILAALGMVLGLVEGDHIRKVRFLTLVTAENVGKDTHHAFGKVALALQNLVEHRRIKARLVGDIPMAKTPVACVAFLVGIAQKFAVVQILKKINHV